MTYPTEIEIHDFYDRELGMTASVTDEGGWPTTVKFQVESDPGAPGQSVELSLRMVGRLIEFLTITKGRYDD